MNAKIANEGASTYVLSEAILLYKVKATYATEAIAMSHPIHHSTDGAVLGAGRVVTEGLASALLEQFQQHPLTYVQPEIVASGSDAMAWWEPAQQRTLYFSVKDPAVQKLDGQSIPTPALVFIARRNSLSIFALAESARPTADTKLYHAPFYNIYDNGMMCIGSTLLPKTVDRGDTRAWSNGFFASSFTHVSGRAARWTHHGSYAELLSEAIAAGAHRTEWLVPTKLTLSEAVCGK